MGRSQSSPVSRREALGGGLAVGVGALLARPVPGVSAPALPLITKAIPSSGEKLPVIGLGTDKFALSEREPILAQIHRMQELGGTLIDASDTNAPCVTSAPAASAPPPAAHQPQDQQKDNGSNKGVYD